MRRLPRVVQITMAGRILSKSLISKSDGLADGACLLLAFVQQLLIVCTACLSLPHRNKRRGELTLYEQLIPGCLTLPARNGALSNSAVQCGWDPVGLSAY